MLSVELIGVEKIQQRASSGSGTGDLLLADRFRGEWSGHPLRPRSHPIAIDLGSPPVEEPEKDVVLGRINTERSEVLRVANHAAGDGKSMKLIPAVAAETVDEIDQPVRVNSLIDVVVASKHRVHAPFLKGPAHPGGFAGMSTVH